jgi:hypothetical protein
VEISGSGEYPLHHPLEDRRTREGKECLPGEGWRGHLCRDDKKRFHCAAGYRG